MASNPTSDIQKYVGLTWLNTLPFAHERSNPALPWIDPGPPSKLYTAGGTPTAAEIASDLEYKQGCLYVLVLDNRKEEEPEYWLQQIESLGGKAPVLVVFNKQDENA